MLLNYHSLVKKEKKIWCVSMKDNIILSILLLSNSKLYILTLSISILLNFARSLRLPWSMMNVLSDKCPFCLSTCLSVCLPVSFDSNLIANANFWPCLCACKLWCQHLGLFVYSKNEMLWLVSLLIVFHMYMILLFSCTYLTRNRL